MIVNIAIIDDLCEHSEIIENFKNQFKDIFFTYIQSGLNEKLHEAERETVSVGYQLGYESKNNLTLDKESCHNAEGSESPFQ